MKETELLEAITGAYQYMGTPQVLLSDGVNGLTKLSVKIFRMDADKTPPEGDVYVMNYFVVDRGKPEESAYLSPTLNNTIAVQAVKAKAIELKNKIPG